MPTKKVLLFISDSTARGRGDFEYLMTLSDSNYLMSLGMDLEDVEIKRVMYVSTSNDTLMRNEKCLIPDQPGLTVFLYPKEGSVRNHLANLASSEDIAHIVVVSVEYLRRMLPESVDQKNVSVIGAHASLSALREHLKFSGKQVLFSQQRVLNNFFPIGVGSGFLMPKPLVPIFQSDERLRCFNSITDEAYKTFLLQNKTPADFFNTTLFVPAYLQSEADTRLFLNALTSSQLDNDFRAGTTIHLSLQSNVNHIFNTCQNVIDALYDNSLQALLNRGYTKIVVRMGADSQEISLPTPDDKPLPEKVFRIISGMYLKEKKDFEKLYGVAQKIAVTSGDNTFNNAIAKGVIPYNVTTDLNQILKNEIRDFISARLDRAIQKGVIVPEKKDQVLKLVDALMPRGGPDTIYNEENCQRQSMIIAQTLTESVKNGSLIILGSFIKTLQDKHDFDNTMREKILPLWRSSLGSAPQPRSPENSI